ncbi:putative acetylcholinesterase [Apostichopus japonicus]|uniref:Putative acetylcholinesterase n=1 Tax=Stichopus japonicus TaxID=307972 RepID=A0A2G8L5P5_STIJA|nr:putative acetylcholinesterase [Apostichopus japonicus]
MGDVMGERTPYQYSDSKVTVNTTVDIFRGIPYAKPPVGDLRFAKPEPMDPWTEVYNATYFRPICWQIVIDNSTDGQSEDCLHLNIYSPNVQGSGYPVFVRIHGGGFIQGSGIGASYDGRPIVAMSDMVVVTMNYRLNAFGFLATGDPEMPGNYGLWDQNLSLKWIKENIHGARWNVMDILVERHFDETAQFQTIASGNMMAPWGLEQDTQKARSDAFLVGRLAGCGDATNGGELRDCLRQVDEERLIAAANAALATTTNVIPLVPTIDGEFITDDPRHLLEQKKFKMCDVMLGNTKDDGSLVAMRAYPGQLPRPQPTSDFETFLDRVARFTYTYTNDVIVNSIAQQYLDWEDFDDPETNYFYKYIELITDEAFHCPGEHTARVYAMSGNSVYRYYFTFLRPGTVQIPTWYGVGHTNDLPYVFAYFMNPRMQANFTSREKDFSLDLMRYYTNFAKTGDPNVGIPVSFSWEPFTVPGLNILDEKPDFEAIPGARAEFNAFWNDYVVKLVTYSADLSEVEHQWREEFNRWKNDDLPAWRQDFQEYQDSDQCST